MTKEQSLFGAVCCFAAGLILSQPMFWSEQFHVASSLGRWLDFGVVALAAGWLGSLWQKQLDASLPATVTQLSQQLLGIGQQVAIHSENFNKLQGVINEQGKAISQLMPKLQPPQPTAVPLAQLTPVPPTR